ncbi:MAG: PAS domain S-box protein [Acidimicrobiia bacterium]
MADLRVEMADEANALAGDLAELIARETASLDAVVAFAEIEHDDPVSMGPELERFAASLLDEGETIQSVQVAPDSVLEYVYPIEGNEAALGLDLLADPERRAVLVPTIESGETSVQGPVELVQGGLGLLVRKPIYRDDGSFYGFAAILLDWDRVVEVSGIDEPPEGVLTGTRVGDGRVVAGSPEAFLQSPVIEPIHVGFTNTVWEVAARPVDGWASSAPSTVRIWALSLVLATVAALFVHEVLRRPEVLREEREKAVRELAFVEARYQATVRHAAVGVMITDADGRIVYANPALHRIADLPDDSLKGVLAHDLIHPNDVGPHYARVARLRLGATEVESDVRVAGSTERLVRAIVTMISGARGDDLYVSIIEDVTERRQAEQDLARSEARFRQLFEQAPIAIQREDYSRAVAEFDEMKRAGVTDIRAYLEESTERLRHLLGLVRIIDANAASQLLQGHLEDANGDLTLLDHESPPALGTFLDTLVAVWNGESHLEQSVETVDEDGSPMFLDVRWTTPMEDGRPDYSRMLVTIADITELREVQHQLESLIESKDRFVASVAHELRTPLTAVVGFAQELRNEQLLYSPREIEEFHELIATHSLELSNIIEDLLVWARADIGEVRVDPTPIELGAQVRESLASVKGLEAELEEPDGPIEGLADPNRLRQIVRNLATNAIRYGGEDVRVVVYREGGDAVVDVSDDGPKLTKRDREQIFEPYVRSTSETVTPGSIGLGLSVSRSLARAQDGDLVCLREDDRNVFRLTLPLARAKTAAAV